jgi:hypothetical protein
MITRQAFQQDRRLLQDRDVYLDAPKPRTRRCQSRLSKGHIRKARDLLRCSTKDIRSNITEVPELGIYDCHGLLTQAMQRLSMLLGEPLAPLSALAWATGETTSDNLWLRCRHRPLWRSLYWLGSGGTHSRIVVAYGPSKLIRL